MVPTPQRTPHENQKKRPKRRVTFDEEKLVEIRSDARVAKALPQAAHVLSGPALTPGTLFKEGLVVRGTFLNVPAPLPTPFKKKASRRSHSEPRNMGSQSHCQELSLLIEATEHPVTSAKTPLPNTDVISCCSPAPWLSELNDLMA
jgi:hypothetical protein